MQTTIRLNLLQWTSQFNVTSALDVKSAQRMMSQATLDLTTLLNLPCMCIPATNTTSDIASAAIDITSCSAPDPTAGAKQQRDGRH
jgi:hypothetical protein